MPLTSEQQARTAFKGLFGLSNTLSSRGLPDERALYLPPDERQVNNDEVRADPVPKPAPPALRPDELTADDSDYLATEQMLDDNDCSLVGSIVGRTQGVVTRYVDCPMVSVSGSGAGTNGSGGNIQYRSWCAVRELPAAGVKMSSNVTHPNAYRPNKHEAIGVVAFAESGAGAAEIYLVPNTVPSAVDPVGYEVRGHAFARGTRVTAWDALRHAATVDTALVAALAASEPVLFVGSTEYTASVSRIVADGAGNFTFHLDSSNPANTVAALGVQPGHMLSERLDGAAKTPVEVRISTRHFCWAPYMVNSDAGGVDSSGNAFTVSSTAAAFGGLAVDGLAAGGAWSYAPGAPFDVTLNRNWHGRSVDARTYADAATGVLDSLTDATYTVVLSSISNDRNRISSALLPGAPGGDFVFRTTNGVTRFFNATIPASVNQQFPLLASFYKYSGAFGAASKVFAGGATAGTGFDIKALQIDDRNLSTQIVDSSMALQIGGDFDGSWRLVVQRPEGDAYDGIDASDTTFHIQVYRAELGRWVDMQVLVQEPIA